MTFGCSAPDVLYLHEALQPHKAFRTPSSEMDGEEEQHLRFGIPNVGSDEQTAHHLEAGPAPDFFLLTCQGMVARCSNSRQLRSDSVRFRLLVINETRYSR